MADYQDAFQRIDATVQQRIDILGVPDLTYGLTDSREELSVKIYNLAHFNVPPPLTRGTLFQIGSISKAFTSIVLLQLTEQGMIDLHAPLANYLPWFEISSEYSPITLYHLMSHTAGIITGSESFPSPFIEVWNLRHTRAAAPPGEVFHYSNTGYKALGLVAEAVLGQGLGEILRQRVLDPLGMFDTEPVITNQIRSRLAVGYQPYFDDRPLPNGGRLSPAPWFEADTADGSISSNAGDMCCYLRFLLTHGEGLLSPESFEMLIAPVIPTGDKTHGEHYGLGLFSCQIDGHRIIGHSGGMVGFTADLLADLDGDLGVVVLTNGQADPEKISRYILKTLWAAREGDQPGPELTLDPYDFIPDEYVGKYFFGEKMISFSSQDGKLCLDYGGESIILEPREPDIFLVPQRDFELFPLRFSREGSPGKDGKVPVGEVFYGSDLYLRSGFQSEESIEIPPEWEQYIGHYRSYNPWLSNFRILIQKDTLVLTHQMDEDFLPLSQTAPGKFRVGSEPTSPEFIHFDLIINGKAMRANFSGGIYGRSFTL